MLRQKLEKIGPDFILGNFVCSNLKISFTFYICKLHFKRFFPYVVYGMV